jgi:hypothetical protein
MKDKKFAILLAMAITWLILFAGTALGEIKLSPNVERFAMVIVLVYFAYWSYSALRWVKKPDVTEDKSETKSSDTKESPKS